MVGPGFRRWQKRYFVLTRQGVLFYLGRKGAKDPKGAITLRNVEEVKWLTKKGSPDHFNVKSSCLSNSNSRRCAYVRVHVVGVR